MRNMMSMMVGLSLMLASPLVAQEATKKGQKEAVVKEKAKEPEVAKAEASAKAKESPPKAPAAVRASGVRLDASQLASRIKRMRPAQAAKLFEVMSPGEAATIFVHLDRRTSGRVLNKMQPEAAHKLVSALQGKTPEATETPAGS